MSVNYVEIIKINGNTWRIEDDFVRFFLLEGQQTALMIDTGVNCPDALEIGKSLTDKPISLINTHGDGDHTSGNGAFEKYYITREDYKNCGMAEKYPNSRPMFVEDKDIINLGSRPLKIYTIPGHTQGSIAILDINGRFIFTGDTISTAIIYMFGDHRSIPNYIASLDRLNYLCGDYDTIYPSHGAPSLGNDCAYKVKMEFMRALAGELPTVDEELFGTPITTHQGEFCGFYLPRKNK